MSLFIALILKTQSCSISRALSTSPSLHSDQTKKSLHLLFQEAVGLSPKHESDPPTETPQNNEMKTKLLELEQEIRQLKEAEPNKRKTNSLYGVFTGKEVAKKAETTRKKFESPLILKELSPDVKMFVTRLYDEGYFNDANFIGRGHLDFNCFYDSYGRDFIKFAAEKFGEDHQEIAKWLSGSNLKKVALFGCPSLSRKNVFSAKRLRRYFDIEENTVCEKCSLKHSCKFVNQSVWKGDCKTLNLAVVMRIITLYALELIEPELSVPDEIKTSVSRLLKEILRLSRATS